MAQHPPITFRYFDARGRAQAFRYLFAARGIAYTDERVPLSIGAGAVWPAMKEDGSRAGPFHKLPVLHYGERKIAETLAEWGWAASSRSRPVMLADCLLWEELDVAQHVFAERLRLGELPTLARVYAESTGRAAFKKVLAAHSAPVTGRGLAAEAEI